MTSGAMKGITRLIIAARDLCDHYEDEKEKLKGLTDLGFSVEALADVLDSIAKGGRDREEMEH